MTVRKEILELKENMQKDIIGQEEIVDRIVVGVLSDGNLLVEGLPGLAKTRAIKALAKNIEGTFARVQFTPDLKSTDISGSNVLDEETGRKYFEKGPIFNNVVLADEVNRSPPKTQNSLLEAMEERQVTVGGVSYGMPALFMVMATMNPIEQEGTHPLPEAQMDRFLMHVSVHYPNEQAEAEIIRLVRNEQGEINRKKTEKAKKAPEGEVKKAKDINEKVTNRSITKQQTIFKAREEIYQIKVPERIEKYMVDIIFAARFPERFSYELKSFIRCGPSPRGSLALDKCARAHTWLKGKSEVGKEEVDEICKSVLRHRILLGERAFKHRVTADDLVDEILDRWVSC